MASMTLLELPRRGAVCISLHYQYANMIEGLLGSALTSFLGSGACGLTIGVFYFRPDGGTLGGMKKKLESWVGRGVY